MPTVRLVLALHNHQPVGNFDEVFAHSYRAAYEPFLDVLEGYPGLRFSLHTSGPLLEWLVENRPEYVRRVRRLVEAGRVEILGGGFAEPILAMIPHRDRVGQIRYYSRLLEDLFGQPIRGMWMAERVWEAQFARALASAGIEFTVLDDFHFRRAGVPASDLLGYYLTEDEGDLVKVFPGSERLRYLMPFREPHDSYEYLRRIARDRPGSTVVFADDGEKFGSWPETFDHVYSNGWLRRFCDMLSANEEWMETTTFARVVDETVPLGKIYLPDSSYREMNEWGLPPEALVEFQHAVKASPGRPEAERLRPFAHAGGTWRNFKVRYPESDEMYARMLGVSRRVAELPADADPAIRQEATRALYLGQCNCPYWHGAFGGLYLPHLRNAIYANLIAADVALDRSDAESSTAVRLDVGDFNLDARQEVRLQNSELVAFVRPALGGHIYELDVVGPKVNLLATLDRRPEAYHGTITAAATGLHQGHDAPFDPERVVLKSSDLDRRLVYDRHPRKALVDHFLRPGASIEDLQRCRDFEAGDFAVGTYLAKITSGEERASVVMERPGRVDGVDIRLRKTVSLRAGSRTLEVEYDLEGLPEGIPLHFAPEFNLASMAGHAEDRYYAVDGTRAGMLDSAIEGEDTRSVELVDEYLDLRVTLSWGRPAGLWCFPIETVSQSEGGFEGVYQSSTVVPHWVVHPDHDGRWTVKIGWTIDRASASSSAEPSAGRLSASLS